MARDDHEYESKPKPAQKPPEGGDILDDPYHEQLSNTLTAAVLEVVRKIIGHLDRDTQKEHILYLMGDLKDEAMTLGMTDENGNTRR